MHFSRRVSPANTATLANIRSLVRHAATLPHLTHFTRRVALNPGPTWPREHRVQLVDVVQCVIRAHGDTLHSFNLGWTMTKFQCTDDLSQQPARNV